MNLSDQFCVQFTVEMIRDSLAFLLHLGTYYGMSDKGWTDQELFKNWLKHHFLQYAVPN